MYDRGYQQGVQDAEGTIIVFATAAVVVARWLFKK